VDETSPVVDETSLVLDETSLVVDETSPVVDETCQVLGAYEMRKRTEIPTHKKANSVIFPFV